MKLLSWRFYFIGLACLFGSLAHGYSCLVKEKGADVSPVLAKTLLGPLTLAELHEKQSASIEVWRAEDVLWSFTRTSSFLRVEAREESGGVIKSAQVSKGEELVVLLESHGQILNCHFPPGAEPADSDPIRAYYPLEEKIDSSLLIPTDVLEFFGQ